MRILLFSISLSLSVAGFSQVWQNDFSNASDWINTDLNSGMDTWIISSAAIGGSVDSINSATAGNGFAQFNSEGQCSGNHQDVVLTYFQQIDISTNDISYVEFVQHYRRKSDTVYIEFSNDALVWESVRINEEHWYYQQSENPDTVQISIPSALQSQPFWMRFRYSGECGFAWLVDDVKIFEKEQFHVKADGKITMNGLGYIEIAHCFSDTLAGNLNILNFGNTSLTDLVVRAEIFRNDVWEMTIYDTIDVINPEQEINFIIPNLITDPFYQSENFVTIFSLYNAQLDTVSFKDSVLITFKSTKRFSGEVNGYYLSNDTHLGVGNIFICSQFECPMATRVFVPDIPTNVGEFIWLSYFKLNSGVWESLSMTYEHTVSTGNLGNWVVLPNVIFGEFNQYEPGDTGVVVYGTYGNEFSIPYSEADEIGSYFIDLNGLLVYDPVGHAALIELNSFGGPGGTFSCNTCWESINENGLFSIKIIPNPANDLIQLENIDKLIYSIKIFSLDGREVYADFHPNSNTISISSLQSGTYVILVETEEGNLFSERFVKL